jgi:dihydrofolate reductase
MISLIVAVANDNIIGNRGKMPWKTVKTDLERFKEITIGHTIVMGRKTYESIGRTLPYRLNVILTSSNLQEDVSVKVVTDVQAVLDMAEGTEIFIIGGQTLYTQFLPFADKIYLTEIRERIEEGDTFFNYDAEDWETTMVEEYSDHIFRILAKRRE